MACAAGDASITALSETIRRLKVIAVARMVHPPHVSVPIPPAGTPGRSGCDGEKRSAAASPTEFILTDCPGKPSTGEHQYTSPVRSNRLATMHESARCSKHSRATSRVEMHEAAASEQRSEGWSAHLFRRPGSIPAKPRTLRDYYTEWIARQGPPRIEPTTVADQEIAAGRSSPLRCRRGPAGSDAVARWRRHVGLPHAEGY